MIRILRRLSAQVNWFGIVVIGGAFLCAAMNNMLAAFMWVLGLWVGFLSVALDRNERGTSAHRPAARGHDEAGEAS